MTTSSFYLESLKVARAQSNQPTRSISVAVGGNCNARYLMSGLRSTLSERSLVAQVTELPMGGYVQWALEGNRSDVVVLWISSFAASIGETSAPPFDSQGLASAVKALLAKNCRVVIILPEILESECDPWSPLSVWRRNLTVILTEMLPADVIQVDPIGLQADLGLAHWIAQRYWSLARAPCHPDAAARLGALVAHAIGQTSRAAIKAVVVDLDNTLWGGVVGDDGLENLKLDPFGEGRPYLAMQRFLIGLRDRGIPICAVSKNEHDVVMEVFRQRAEMLLKVDDFYDIRCSWDSKRDAIGEFADDLNVGSDSVCFIDDSPHERAEAKFALPDLVVPELPADPDRRVSYLLKSGLFCLPKVGADDRQRARRYEQDKIRRSERASAQDLDEYLAGLGMKLTVSAVERGNLPRVLSLIHKTNQFNLSNIRHEAAAVMAFGGQATSGAFAYSLQDRIGDSGLIGVILASVEGRTMFLDTWVLSCRAFGRGVEAAMFDHVLGWAAERGAERVLARFVKTDRNGLVETELRNLGFRPAEDSVFAFDGPLAPKHHLEILPTEPSKSA